MDINSGHRSDAALKGLRKSHEIRRKRTLDIVSAAINTLRDTGERITLGRISEATRHVTGTGRCISESTILRNAGCKSLYEQAANPVKRRRASKSVLGRKLEDEPSEIEVRRMHFLLRSTKAELVALTIKTERELESLSEANNLLREKMLLSELGHLK
jgi:hypothetical protein